LFYISCFCFGGDNKIIAAYGSVAMHIECILQASTAICNSFYFPANLGQIVLIL